MDSPISLPGFRSILCGVDFSHHSAIALRYADALASERGAKLSVIYAVDPLLTAAAAAAYNGPTIAKDARVELKQFVRDTLRPTDGRQPRLIVTVGKPVPAILTAADRLHADVIVVGAHGLTGIRKAFFGSVTEALLRRATCPVLVVPDPRRRSAGGLMPQHGRSAVSGFQSTGCRAR